MNTYNINYLQEDEVKSFDVEIKFLTVELRQKIIRRDYENQKLLKELVEKQNGKVYSEQLLATEKLNEYMAIKPDTSDEQKNLLQTALQMDIVLRASNEDLLEAADNRELEAEYMQKISGEMFKLIVNQKKLDDDIRKLINSDYTSDFWRNVDMKGIDDVISSFRTIYKIR